MLFFNFLLRYRSQGLGHPVYQRPPVGSGMYPYEQFPRDQPVYITPVQQQPDGLVSTVAMESL